MAASEGMHIGMDACFCVVTVFQGLGERGGLAKAPEVQVIFAGRE